jgi:IPT/TIG domain
MMAGCGPGQFIPDAQTPDKINLLMKGNYYGHPNAKRAAVLNDNRQCYWHSAESPGDSSYTAPLVIMPSSTDGIIEYQADHFDGQLRGNLITSKFMGGLFRVILTPDGLGVIPQSKPPLPLVGDGGLDVTQAPDGSLIEVRNSDNSLYVHKPNEIPTTALQVKSVFPRRGGKAGGTKLSVYGVNFSANSTVKVGSSNCPVLSTTATKIECTLPGGSGTVDIVVSGSAGTYKFQRGYRYISGFR